MPVKRQYLLITLLVVVGLAPLVGSVLLRGPKVGSLTVTALRCDNGRNPLGVDAGQPQLGWQLGSNVRGTGRRRIKFSSSPPWKDWR